MEGGLGTPTVAAQVTMQRISEGGMVVTAPRAKSLGKQGRWNTRVRWSRLGTARDAAFRVRMSGARMKLVQLYVEVEPRGRG